jgi:NitT/TauT family transport system substrate-binding protein
VRFLGNLKAVAALAAAAALAVGATACGGDDSGSAKAGGGGGGGKHDMSITVGLPVQDSSYAPLYLAVDKGFFKDEGLDVKLVAFQSGSDLGKAVIGGSVQIANSAMSEMVLGINQRQPLKAFWGGMNMLSFSWWARPPIKNIQQAKGKKWGVTRVGSSTDFLTRYLLTKNGLNPEKDVTIVGVGPAAGAQAAIKANKIQVATASQPSNFFYQDEGYAKIGDQSDFSDQYPTHVSYGREQWLKDNPDAVKAYLRAVVRGTQLALSDPAAAKATMAKYPKVPAKYLDRTYDYNKPGWAVDGALPDKKSMEVFWDIGVQNKQWPKPLPESQWLDRTWLDSYDDWAKDLQNPKQ